MAQDTMLTLVRTSGARYVLRVTNAVILKPPILLHGKVGWCYLQAQQPTRMCTLLQDILPAVSPTTVQRVSLQAELFGPHTIISLLAQRGTTVSTSKCVLMVSIWLVTK